MVKIPFLAGVMVKIPFIVFIAGVMVKIPFIGGRKGVEEGWRQGVEGGRKWREGVEAKDRSRGRKKGVKGGSGGW